MDKLPLAQNIYTSQIKTDHNLRKLTWFIPVPECLMKKSANKFFRLGLGINQENDI